MLVECDTLDSNFFAPVRSPPNFAEATPCRNILGIIDFVLDQQPRRQYPPVCAQSLNLLSQVIPQGIRDLLP